MCGIVGYIGQRKAYPILIKGLKRLEYRGYDSAGVALISDNRQLNVYKAKGKVSELETFVAQKDISGSIGIAHTRWATHGEPCSVNAHPHYSSSERFALIMPLGVAMELPKGYEAHIVPRSSTYKNFGVIQANHCGVVDGSYCGDNDMWRMPVIAMRDTQIHVNDRICQFRIMKNQPEILFEEVEHLEGKDRGGFGTTGKQ